MFLLDKLWELRPAFIGAAGTGLTVGLENVNILVAILVGLTTLIYLWIKIVKEIRK